MAHAELASTRFLSCSSVAPEFLLHLGDSSRSMARSWVFCFFFFILERVEIAVQNAVGVCTATLAILQRLHGDHIVISQRLHYDCVCNPWVFVRRLKRKRSTTFS
jgi:hypothetical protein